MSPVSFDTSSGVQGADASTTVAGIAAALIVGMYRPDALLWSAGICAVIAAIVWLTKLRKRLGLVARFGLGAAVGTALFYGLVAIGVLPHS
jgi:4-hydroxybenzoate polyprenyltransferase